MFTVSLIFTNFRIRHVGDDFAVRYSNLDDRTELGEPTDQRSPDSEKTFTVDEAVEALGFGRFQLKLSILTGMAWVSFEGVFKKECSIQMSFILQIYFHNLNWKIWKFTKI